MPVSTWLQPPPEPIAQHVEAHDTMFITLHIAPESYYKRIEIREGLKDAHVILRRSAGDDQTQLGLLLPRPQVAHVLQQFTGIPFGKP